MPDNFEYKIADALAADVEARFDAIDANHDGRLSKDEITRPLPTERADADAHFRNAALRFVDDYLDTCGHKERLSLKPQTNSDGLIKLNFAFTKDLNAAGIEQFVVDRADLANWRAGFAQRGQLNPQEALPKPNDKDLVAIVKDSFEYLDSNHDGKLNAQELQKFQTVPAQSAPGRYIRMTAGNYMQDRLAVEGQTHNVSSEEKVSDRHWVDGPRMLVPMRIGKSTILMPVGSTGHYEPPTYRTVTNLERFITKDDLSRWLR